MKQSGMLALSEPGMLEEVVATAGLVVRHDEEVSCPITFTDIDEGLRAFLGAGPTALAVKQSGERAVAEAAREGLDPFVSPDGRVSLPGWYPSVIAG